MRTLSIERYHIYGTASNEVRARYQGKTLSYWKDGHKAYLQAPSTLDATRWFVRHGMARGFTHVCFTGSWPNGAKPSGGKIERVLKRI